MPITSSVASSNTNAIPGGDFINSQNTVRQKIGVKIILSSLFQDLVLPPRHVCDFLVQSYQRSVHWFMMLFHGPSFENDYKEIMDSQAATFGELGKVVLVLMIFTMGARYTTNDQAMEVCGADLDLASLQRNLLFHVQSNLFDVLDTGGIESTQICILLSSFYLYNGRPNFSSCRFRGRHSECASTRIA